MYSPFLLVFTSIGFAPLSRFSIAILAPSTGVPCGSTTLPLIWPLWADAGGATNTRPRARAQIATDRRMMVPVMDSSIDIAILHRPPADVRDEVLAHGTAARGL